MVVYALCGRSDTAKQALLRRRLPEAVAQIPCLITSTVLACRSVQAPAAVGRFTVSCGRRREQHVECYRLDPVQERFVEGAAEK